MIATRLSKTAAEIEEDDRRAAERARQKRKLPIRTLQPRHIRTLLILTKGLSNQEIAQQQGISLHTTTENLKEIFQYFHVRSRTELLARFIDERKVAAAIEESNSRKLSPAQRGRPRLDQSSRGSATLT